MASASGHGASIDGAELAKRLCSLFCFSLLSKFIDALPEYLLPTWRAKVG
jgi:hypothetical protein